MKTMKACVVCSAQMGALDIPWVFECPTCHMLSSSLEPDIEGEKYFSEAERLEGLSDVRRLNFDRMLNALAPMLPAHGRALEIGPGQGFFLAALRARGWDVTAIEPDHDMADALCNAGWRVIRDLYPSGSLRDEKFDLIAFNDVLEHIPDVRSVLKQVKDQLTPQGALLVNLPSAHGLFYRVAATTARLGWPAPYYRMWQRGLTSPHVHYFTPHHLRSLARSEGFDEKQSGRLPALTFNGLRERIGYTRDMSNLTSALVFGAASIAIPIAHLFPSDITFHLFGTSTPAS